MFNNETFITQIKKKFSEGKTAAFVNNYFSFFLIFILLWEILLGGLFIVLPKYIQIKRVNAEILAAENDRESKSESLSSLVRTNEAYKKIPVEDIHRIYALLPDKGKAEDILSHLETLLNGNAFYPKAITVSDGGSSEKTIASVEEQNNSGQIEGKSSSVSDDVGKISFSFTIDDGEMNYAKLKRFLGIIESDLRLIDIDTLSFVPEKSVTINASVYYLK